MKNPVILDPQMGLGWACPSCGVGNNPRQAYCINCIRTLADKSSEHARMASVMVLENDEIPENCVIIEDDPSWEVDH